MLESYAQNDQQRLRRLASLDDDADGLEEASSEPVPPPGPRRRKRKKRHAFNTFLSILAIIGISVMLAAAILVGANDMLAIFKNEQSIQVVIPENADTSTIAEILQEEGVINHAWLFRIISKVSDNDGKYQHGLFTLDSKMGYQEIMDTLQTPTSRGDETVTIMFPEGWTLRQYADALEQNEVCSAEDFLDRINRSSFGLSFERDVEAGALEFYRMEGYAFPDTYEFYIGEIPESVAKKFLTNFQKKIEPLYDRMEELGMSLEDTITLASIIQAEAGDSENSEIVSSVFHNRLNNPDDFPRLQSDPTGKYARLYIAPYQEYRNEEMLLAYDTYESDGLPPGAICNPGMQAIRAALYPRQTDYFYFCSDLETGEFYFAETLSEHEANLKKAGLT